MEVIETSSCSPSGRDTTRHPRLRRRNSGKSWEPHKRSRTWLGTSPTPETADAAAPRRLPPTSQRAATDVSFPRKDSENAVLEYSSAIICLDRPQEDLGVSSLNVEASRSFGGVEWVDEEAMFNMPFLLESMAESLLLTPPAMEKGCDWGRDLDHDIELSLWEG